MKTLYLHGYLGKPINYEDWISPKLDYNDIPATIEQINKIIVEEEIEHIVAKSIGCYFALLFYSKVDELHLINPCIRPYELLPKCYDWVSDDYVDALKSIDPIKDKFSYTGSLFLELGDEKIDHVETSLAKLKCDDIVINAGGNHRYTKTAQAFEKINHRIKYGYAIGEIE